MHFAISLLGGLTLFLFGLKMVSGALTSLSGGNLRRLIKSFTRNWLTSSGVGLLMAILLQSSSAMSVLLVGLAGSAAVTLRAAIPLLLGANLGATMTVQLIAFNLSDLAFVLIAAGFVIKSISAERLGKAIGDVILGFGLVFFGMGQMSQHGPILSQNPEIKEFLTRIDRYPILTVIASATLTAILQASSATIGISMTLVTAGVIPFESAFFIIAGANIGTTSTAIISAIPSNYEGRRIAFAHLLLRVIGAVLFLGLIPLFSQITHSMGGGTARMIANANSLFAAALLITGMVITPMIISVVQFFIPRSVREPRPILHARFLNAQFIPYPAIALDQSWKEINRIVSYLEDMMAEIGGLFRGDDLQIVRNVKRKEKYVDSLVGQTVQYLVKISQGTVPDSESKRLVGQLFLIDNLETIADYIKRMGAQSAKRIEKGFVFSAEGLSELNATHFSVANLLKEMAECLRTNDLNSLSKLAESVRLFEESEDDLKLSHFNRLLSGKPESTASTAIHMEMINLLSQVISRIGFIAEHLGTPRKEADANDLNHIDID